MNFILNGEEGVTNPFLQRTVKKANPFLQSS